VASPALRVTPRLVFGLVVVWLGVVFFLDSWGFADADLILPYWPIALIAVGAIKVWRCGPSGGRAPGIFWIVAGTILLLSNLSLVHLNLRRTWPVLLVVAGGWIVFRAVRGVSRAEAPAAQPENALSLFAFMAGVNRKPAAGSFRGGDATAIMGGCEIDLRDSTPAVEGAVIEVFALWGGIEITVPGDWTVDLQATAILAGVEDTRKSVGSDPTKRLTVKGLAVMGGVEIKN